MVKYHACKVVQNKFVKQFLISFKKIVSEIMYILYGVTNLSNEAQSL